MIQPYNEDQKDTLKEIVNIAMGQAGDSLARILDVFVTLSIPTIELIEVSNIVPTVTEMINTDKNVSAVRQSFYNQFQGEAIVLFNQAGCNDLAILMGYETDAEDINKQELLLDIANILAGACLNGIGEQLGTELSYSPPTIMAENATLENVLNPDALSWSHALLMEVNFSLENSEFKSHLLILMAEETINSLRITLDKYLEAI